MNLRFKISLLNFIFAFGIIAFSKHAHANDFCAKINDFAKNKDETTKHKAAIQAFANPIMSKTECELIKKHTNPGWVLIDARDKASRKATGSFKGAVKLTSDHHDASKHKFEEASLKKKLGKYFGKKDISLDELKGKNLILFCNGLKCFRSSWAACSLQKLGFSKDKVHVVLDGHTGLKENCLK